MSERAGGGTAATATSSLDDAPWAHSLRKVERPPGEERVRIVTLDQTLAVPTGGARTIAKIDAKEIECDDLARSGTLARPESTGLLQFTRDR